MLDNDGYFVIQHDGTLNLLAAGMCLLATLACISLFEQAKRSSGGTRLGCLAAAAMAGGTGIWTTHFFAMMAFVTGLRSGYDIVPMGAAFVSAVVVTGLGLAVAAGSQSRRRALAGGALVGVAVAMTHAFGMAGFFIAGDLQAARPLLLGSAVFGVALAAVALLVAGGRRPRHRISAAVLLAGAIGAHTFLALDAVSIAIDPTKDVPPNALTPDRLVLPVSLASTLILAGVFLVLALDIRSRRRAAGEAERMKSLADAAVEGLVITDGEWIVTANSSFAALTGFSREDLSRCSLSRCLPDRAIVEALLQTPDRPLETQLTTQSGETIPVEIIPHGIEFAGRRHHAIAVRDLRARHHAEERIRFLAHHDVLTGLPNRALFDARLDDAIAAAERRQRCLAVLCLDLDRFKEINDLFGHPAGDEALKAVGRALANLLRGAETAARLGGDEFAVILPEANAEAAAGVAARILHALSLLDAARSAGPCIATSIGIAVFPTDANDRQTLLGAADTALYRAKADGRGTLRFYEAGMGLELRDRRRIEHDLRSSVGRGEMTLVYQPQLEVGTGVLVGFEALLRWGHPDRGFVSPALFIPIAEESGAILGIGEWVLTTACSEAATWSNPLRVAVNVSAVQLHAAGFATFVAGVLADTGIAPGRLELEITETALIRDIDRALATLRKLKALGVKIAMDDFGTGYSSLSNLRAFPFDRIKIDGSFIQSVDSNSEAAAIVRAILELGRGLDLPILAEGVETAAELDFLGSELCQEVQGYLLGRPAAIESFAPFTGRRPIEEVVAAA